MFKKMMSRWFGKTTTTKGKKRAQRSARRKPLALEHLEERVVPSTITQWTFENDSIAVNNSPAPSTGTGTASAIGMTNSFNSTTSTNTDDVVQGANGDTGTNNLADLTQIWRVRGQSPGNGWSSQAPIGTQGAVFATSTVGYFGPINVSFDWYTTTQGEANLQLEYTTNGTTWINVPINIGANSSLGLTALTNSSSANTVNGAYISDNKAVNGSLAGQDWFQGLTATITDPAAANNPNFAIEMVNASTGADDVSTAGTALNNTSGNWRFDNIDIADPQAYTPGNLVVLQAGDGVTSYNAQAPLYLNEIGTSTAQTGLIAVSGTTADSLGNVTVTTTGTQTFTAGQQVQISGVQVGTNLNSAYNGVYSITSVNNSGNTFTYFAPLAAGLAAGSPAPNTSTATGGAFAYAVVQQSSIPAVGGDGNPANQPVTIDLSAAAGNGQLTRSSDGSSLNFDGVDSTVNNGGLTAPSTPTGQDNRDIGVLTGNPNTASDYNTTTQGPFYVGDDNRGSVTGPGGQIWSAGHPNQAGGAVSQGVHYFSTTGPSIGVQVSASTNIRGINIGFDNRVYFSTASGIGGATILNTAGIFTDAQALPTSPTPANDIQVVPALFGASKLGGIFFADVNGDGILSNGDKLYFLDDGTVGGAGTGGIYVSTWNDANTSNPWNTPNNAAAVAAGYVDHWSVPVRLGDAPVQNGSGGVGQLRGLTGTVLANGTVELYTTAYDDSAQDNSIIEQWVDPNSGVSVVKATESGTTVTLTTRGSLGSSLGSVQIDGVVVTTATSNGLGLAALNQGYNGDFSLTLVSANSDGTYTYTYTDTNSGANNLAEIDNTGAADQTLTGTVIAEANSGQDVIAGKDYGDIGLRGVAFAPVAATSVTLTQSPANPLTPGTAVTLTAKLSNPETGVNLNGDVVTFIDQNTNTVLGTAIVGTTTSDEAILNLPIGVFGDHYVQAYFAGGGTQALAAARSNTIEVIQAGQGDTSTTVTSSLAAAATGKPVTLTATVITDAAGDHAETGMVSITGSITNGSATVTGLSSTASLAVGMPVSGLGIPLGTDILTINSGSSITLTNNATATNTSAALTFTGGTVSFYNGSVNIANLLGTTALNSLGVATLTTAFGTAGAQTIIAVYNGDNTYDSTQGTTTVNVAANATATFSSSANNVALGATPTYTATVTGNSTVGTPTGTVTFTLTSATTGAVVGTSSAMTLSGSGSSATATWASPALTSPGSYFVTLTYAPATGSGYNAFSIDTISSTNGTAFVETVKQAFTPGNLVAVQRGDGNINLGSSGYLVFLDEYTTSGTLVQRIALPNLDAGTTHALLLSGQNGGEGLLNRSANGQYLTIGGYDVPVGHTFLTSTFPYQYDRTVALVDGTGNVNTTTAIGVANPTGSGVPAAIKSATATATGTGQTVTITLTASNFFMAGQSVTIAGITDGSSGTAYDGTFTITAATGTTLSFVDPNNISSTSPTVSSATAASPASVPYNPTDVVTNDGQSFYVGTNLPVGDTIDGGILYVASVGATTATEIGPVGSASASIGISGGQLYSTSGSGKVSAVGTGLPTTIGQTLTGLPSFPQNYDLFYHNMENAEQVLLLNTHDGSTNNPNVAYVADQANGLLKFTLFTATNISLSYSSGTGMVTGTINGAGSLVSGQFVSIANASDPTFDGTFLVTVSGSTFTYTPTTAPSSNAATGATATEWVYGNSGGAGVFGQKLVFAGGVTAVTGDVVNPGPSAQVQLYVTGVNVQQQNPNQLDSFLDTSGGTAGFPSGNFTNLAFVGGSPTSNPTSPNGNENFAGLAFAPGYATITAVAVTGNATSGYTVTATVTDPTGGSNVPTGAVYFYLDGSSTPYSSVLLNGSGVATLTITAGTLTGEHSFTAVYQGDVKDDQSTGVSGQAFGAGNLIATVSTIGSTANGAATSISEYQTSGGSAVQTIYLPTTGAGELTEKGNTTTSEGYLSDSADGHSASLAGYLVDAGSSTTGANAAIAVLQANGSISTTTQIASSDIGGSVRAAVSADGQGFWVATANSLRYVPFGNSSSTTSTLVSSYYPSPSTVEIQASNGQVGTPGQPGTLYITGAAGSPGGGLSSIDGPAQVLGGLATVADQAEQTLGNGSGTDFNTAVDASGKFPATNQIAVSPDGLTIFVADGRTDGSGGILEYADTLGSGAWTLVGHAQVSSGSSSDTGLIGLVADFSNPSAPILYATTSGTTSNRIVEITGGTTNGNTPSFTFTPLETSPTGSLFHGVAFAPKAAAAAASTTTATVTTTGGGHYADSANNVTLSATVTDNSGGTGDPTPTGYVSFQTSTGVEIGSAPLVNGTATLQPVSDLLVAQSGSIKAVYTGDSFYAGSSSSSQTATVATETTTTALTVQFLNVATGVTDNLSAQVTYTGSNAAPTGTVTFWQDAVGTGGTNLGTATVTPTIVSVNGIPTLEFLASGVSDKFTSTGTHPIFAVYSGDTNFATSTSASNPIAVVLSPTVTVTTSSANPGNSGASVTETVTVTGTGATPTGYVQFYDNLVPIGSPVLLSGGTAAVTVTTNATQGVDGNGNQFLLPGLQSISAVYSGNSTYFSGTGVNEQAVQTNAFGASDKFVYRVGDGINSLDAPTGSTVQGSIGSTIYIDEINATTGDVVQSIILPTADGTGTQASIHAIVGNGQQSATEQLTVDGANSALWLTGYDTNPLLGVTVSSTGVVSGQGTLAPGIPTVSGSITRAVARVTTGGVVQDVTMSKTNSGSGFGNFNAVYSPDGNSFYLTGDGGVVYFSSFSPASGTVSPTATINTSAQTGTMTAIEPDGGNLAIVGAPGFGDDGPQVYTGLPTSAATANTLPGFSDAAATAGGQASTFYIDAYFTHLDNTAGPGGTSTAPAGINTFYLSDDGPNFAAGAITKWSLVNGTWVVTDHITANGIAPNPITYYYISGQTLSEGPGSSPVGNVTLYVTYGNGGNSDTGPGQLFSITDDSGYDAVGLTAGTVINQTSSSSNEVYRGVAMFGTTDLTGTPASPLSATENTPLTNVQVATFTDPDDTTTPEPGSSYTVSINWGDGVTSAGTATVTSTNASGSTYSVTGTHTYATSTASGHSFPIIVSIVDPSWPAKLILDTSATVAVATTPFNKLTGSGVPVTGALENTSFTAPVATFTDTIPFGGSPNPVGTYTATINWGDGSSTSTGTITLGTNNGTTETYKVSGTHTYLTESVTPYAISVTITSSLGDANPLTENTTATVGEYFGEHVTATPALSQINETAGTAFTINPLVDFTDMVPNGGTADPTTHYSASINWGDGTSTGTITYINNTGTLPVIANYTIGGSHTYANPGNYTVVVSLVDLEDPKTTYNVDIPATVTSSTVNTTTTLTDNGISAATAGGSIEQGYPIGFTVTVTPASGGPATGSVQLEDAANGDALVGAAQTLVNGSVTFSVAATAANHLGAGSHQLIAVYTPTGSFATSTSGQVAQVVDASFEIQATAVNPNRALVPTDVGFTVTFNAPINTSLLSDYTNSSTATPSVALTTGGSAVNGSVVFDAAGTELTFVATNVPNGSSLQSGILSPGASYTATLSGVTSNSQAFQDTSGDPLAGNGSAGTNYTNTFTSLTSATATTVWLPYLARGFSQPVNVPASSTNGLPIYVTIPSGGTALTSASFTFAYNPALLNVTAAKVDSSISSKFTGSFTINQAAGTVTITLTANSGQSLAAGATYTVVDLTATVQTTATYKDKEILNLLNINLNGGTNNGQDGSQVHVAAFLDNANAVTSTSPEPTVIPSAYSGQDAFDVLNIAGSSSTTILHNIYKLLDPTILGDDANSGHALGQAAFDTLSVAGGSTVANIPTLPNVITAATESSGTVTITTFEALPLTVGQSVTVSGVSVNGYNGTFTVASVNGNKFTYTDSNTGLANSSGGNVGLPNPVGGPDPYLYIVPNLSTTAGSSVTVSVYLDVTDPNGLTYDSDDIAISFDPTRFSASNLSVGNYNPSVGLGSGQLAGSGNVNNTTGQITYSEITTTQGGVFLPENTNGVIFQFTLTVLSNAPDGVASLHLAQQLGTHVTDVNGGNATLNPAPNDSAPPLSGDPSGLPYDTQTDDKFSIVPPSASITTVSISGSTGTTETVQVFLTAGPGGFTYDSNDVAIRFNAAEFSAAMLAVGNYPGIGSANLALSGNIDNTNGLITFSEITTEQGGVFLPAGTTGPIATIQFTVLSSAAQGPSALHVSPQIGTHVTDVNGGNIELTPAPSDNTSLFPPLANDQSAGIAYDPNTDGEFTVTIHPDQPPFDSLPVASAIPDVLFNPSTTPGLHTATPNTLAFTGADAISVTDSDYVSSGPAETTTVTITGTPTGTSVGSVGTLTATAAGSATVSGSGGTTLTISGSPTDITSTLASMIYTPGAGFFGTTTLTVSTDDNGNSGYTGSYSSGLTDTRSTSITVVGLFISEINLDRNLTTAASDSQYIEVYSTAPSYTIPSTVYLVGVNGLSTTASGAPAVGTVQDIFKLGGFQTGGNGYLTLFEKNEPYTGSVGAVAGGAFAANTGSGAGFGNGTSSSFSEGSTTLTSVHTGPSGTTRTGLSPTQFTGDLETGAVSYLLIQTSTTPAINNSINGSSTSSATVAGGATYNGWNVFDGVGVLPTGNGSSANRSYAPITYVATTDTTGTIIAGTNEMSPAGAYTPDYVARIATLTGESNADWLASVLSGTIPNLTLGSNSTQFAGQSLDNMAGPNDWAPELSVAVNDGSSVQHSQVSELTLTFNEPVSIANLSTDFQVMDTSGNPLSINVSDSNGNSSGSDTGVTSVVITFNLNEGPGGSSGDTYAYGMTNGVANTDVYGNTVALNDGNFFLDTVVAEITNNGIALDGAHDGVGGSITSGSNAPYGGQGKYEVDEFWRLFGDVNGARNVDALDTYQYSQTEGSTSADLSDNVASATASGTTVTITTANASPFVVGQRVLISGVTISGSANNAYNGSFTITSVSGDTFTYTAASVPSGPADANTGSIATPTYQWYLDYNQAGSIDVGNTTDSTKFLDNLFGINGGHNYLAP